MWTYDKVRPKRCASKKSINEKSSHELVFFWRFIWKRNNFFDHVNDTMILNSNLRSIWRLRVQQLNHDQEHGRLTQGFLLVFHYNNIQYAPCTNEASGHAVQGLGSHNRDNCNDELVRSVSHVIKPVPDKNWTRPHSKVMVSKGVAERC